MDPVERTEKTNERKTLTLGELISYYYDKFSEEYENPELRNLALTTTLDDILSRAQGL